MPSKRAPAPKLPPGLRVAEADAIATVTMSRPERLNALTFEMYAALRDLFLHYRQRRDLRAVILTGEGRGFCSGGDVEDIIGYLLKMNRTQLGAFTKMTCDVVANMRACPQPIVAAVNGLVAGAGAALAVASDIRVAVPEAKIAFLFTRAGLSAADMGVCYRLPRIVGLGRATEMLLTGDFVDAEAAQRLGLYNLIVTPDHLMDEARRFARKLADGPTEGIPWSKWTLDREFSMTLDEALRFDAKLQADLMKHPDFNEAHVAFSERRPPRYRSS
jgi:enoyl-CoA hydratase/carnithine racemase